MNYLTERQVTYLTLNLIILSATVSCCNKFSYHLYVLRIPLQADYSKLHYFTIYTMLTQQAFGYKQKAN